MAAEATRTAGHYTAGSRVTVNAPHVIHEAIDGEVIIINLGTGTYYSLKRSAAEAWALIQRPGGIARAELVGAIADGFGASLADVEAALEPFLSELEAEGLVATTRQSAGQIAAAVDPERANGQRASASAFEPPTIEKFTDMQDLVLLDPVHEVDEAGWPQARPDVASGSGS